MNEEQVQKIINNKTYHMKKLIIYFGLNLNPKYNYKNLKYQCYKYPERNYYTPDLIDFIEKLDYTKNIVIYTISDFVIKTINNLIMSKIIDFNEVEVISEYDNNIEIDKHGIEIKSIDKCILKLNRKSDDLYYSMNRVNKDVWVKFIVTNKNNEELLSETIKSIYNYHEDNDINDYIKEKLDDWFEDNIKKSYEIISIDDKK